MDISEGKNILDPEKDLLAQMFNAQSEIEKEWAKVENCSQELVFGKLENLHLPEVCRHINNNIYWRMIQEICEATVALKNAKEWRQEKYFTDVNEYLDEIADIMIYFINACLASGISPELLVNSVLKKIEVNKKRLLSHY